MQDKSGGYSKDLSGTVTAPNKRGIARTKVKNPLQRETGTEYTKDADDCSRALTPQQPKMPAG